MYRHIMRPAVVPGPFTRTPYYHEATRQYIIPRSFRTRRGKPQNISDRRVCRRHGCLRIRTAFLCGCGADRLRPRCRYSTAHGNVVRSVPLRRLRRLRRRMHGTQCPQIPAATASFSCHVSRPCPGGGLVGQTRGDGQIDTLQLAHNTTCICNI